MEEKFYLRNRGDGDYFLESRTNNSASVVGSLNPTHFAEHKLSLKNCEAIANGYAFDEYQEGVFYAGKFGHPSPEGFSDEQIGRLHGFIDGFQKALKIISDKKFSDEQMLQAFLKGVSLQIDAPTFQQSLQQTEWEVEIEMKTAWIGQCDCPCHSDGVTIMHFMACCHPKMVESPKLDSDGCLILKRK